MKQGGVFLDTHLTVTFVKLAPAEEEDAGLVLVRGDKMSRTEEGDEPPSRRTLLGLRVGACARTTRVEGRGLRPCDSPSRSYDSPSRSYDWSPSFAS